MFSLEKFLLVFLAIYKNVRIYLDMKAIYLVRKVVN